MPAHKRTSEEIQEWIVDQIAELTEKDPADIHPEEAFANYGLDSMTAVTLIGDLEEYLGLRLEVTLLWDYPTTETLSAHLEQLLAQEQ